MLNLKQARDVSRPDSNDVSLDREPAVVLTVAEQLRFSRERAERTLDEVAGFLKIRKVHLEALEDGRNDELPGHTYAVGFVRAYSEYLGLDREVIAARFKDETAELEAKARLVFPSPMPEGRTPGAAIILIAVVCAALVYGVWMYMSSQDRSLAEVVPALPGALQALVAPESASVAVSNLVVEAPISAPPVELLSSRTSATASSIKLSEPVKVETSPVPVTALTITPLIPAEVASAIVAPETAPASDALVITAIVSPETPTVAEMPGRDSSVVISTEGQVEAFSEADATRPIEIPSPNAGRNNITTDKVPTAAIVMPPMPPQEERTGPRQFGKDNVASRITIVAEIDSWLEIRGSDGSLLLTRVLKTGDTYNVPNRVGLKLHTGNAGGLRFDIDGLRAPAIGPIGAVRRDIALDIDALKAGDTNN